MGCGQSIIHPPLFIRYFLHFVTCLSVLLSICQICFFPHSLSSVSSTSFYLPSNICIKNTWMHLFLSIWFNLLSFFLIPFLTSSSAHLSLMSFPPAKLTHPCCWLIDQGHNRGIPIQPSPSQCNIGKSSTLAQLLTMKTSLDLPSIITRKRKDVQGEVCACV